MKLVVGPNAAELDANYLGVKAKSDLEAPDDSALLAMLLPTDVRADATHVTACWKSRDSCAYRKIAAWMAWSGADDPRPQDIGCEVAAPDAAACEDPAILDVCCFRR